MTALACFCLALLCGSLPFSVWVARLAGADPRSVGDRNPGATNAFKAGGKWVGLAALLLDISKAALPVGLACQVYGLRGPALAAVALAPTLGHAWSPFLGWRGGKAVATMLGVWIGLTLWDVPLVAVAGVTLWFLLLKNSGWALLFTLLGMGVYLWMVRPEVILLAILSLQTLLVLWKYRAELRLPFHHLPAAS
jgi:glycerol-3-phosphate acyltransferase PlsY